MNKIITNINSFLLATLLVLSLLNCKSDKKTVIKEEQKLVTEKMQLDFLADVLKDTTAFSLLHFKEPSISYRKILPHETRTYKNKGEIMPTQVNVSKVIARYLRSEDSMFVFNQINTTYDFDMSKIKTLGYNFIDKKDINHSLEDSIKIIWLSKPFFNKNMNKAYIEVGYKWYWSNSVLYEKKENKWSYSKLLNTTQM